MTRWPARLAAHRRGVTTLAFAFSALALGATGPAAQEPRTANAEVAAEPAQVAPGVVAPATTPAAAAEPQPTPATPSSQAAAPDPIVLAVRERLAAPASRGAAQDRDERQALAAFYKDRSEPLWTDASGLTARGVAVATEIAKADDWGLQATAFELPPASAAASPQQRADDEIRIGIAVLKYARHARGGRLDPTQLSRNFDQRPPVKAAADVLLEIAFTKVPDEYLRRLHPQHPQFGKLRQALLQTRSGKPAEAPKADGPDTSIKIADGPSLKAGQSHATIADLRRRLGVAADEADKSNVLDSKLTDALKTFQREHDLNPTGTLDRSTRQALNRAPKPAAGNDVARIVANMERWRWLPAEMGDFHVWDNIPEYQTRVVRKGEVIHQARIVVGKPETQTPLFSADMKHIVFHPGWGVPDSIKVKELQPYLRPQQSGFFGGFGGTDTSVLRRHNLNVSINGRPVDPSTINWQSVDIRQYQFIQPPGASNVLGQLKFLFPNKHDVYMHDTSQRELFGRNVRTFSHGCVRVDNPRRLAEILLDQDRGMPASEVARLLSPSAPKDNRIDLKAKIPVHITYFTAVGQDDGSLKWHADIYNHDARVIAALAGKPMALEPDPAVVARTSRPRQVREAAAKPSGGFDFFSGLFGN